MEKALNNPLYPSTLIAQATDSEVVNIKNNNEPFVSFNKESELELFFDNLIKKDSFLFLQGHFACTPFLYFNDLKSFSIIRSPLERVVSEWFYLNDTILNYTYIQDLNHKYIQDIQSNERFIDYLFSRINVQSNYLSSNIKWNFKEKGYQFETFNTEQSFTKLLTSIKEKKIVLSTMKNRHFIIIDIEKELEKRINYKKINSSFSLTNLTTISVNSSDSLFELNTVLTKDIIKQFEKTNSLDYQLYNYVELHENKYNRPLYPEDIKI